MGFTHAGSIMAAAWRVWDSSTHNVVFAFIHHKNSMAAMEMLVLVYNTVECL